jgi:hypothetical protein
MLSWTSEVFRVVGESIKFGVDFPRVWEGKDDPKPVEYPVAFTLVPYLKCAGN